MDYSIYNKYLYNEKDINSLKLYCDNISSELRWKDLIYEDSKNDYLKIVADTSFVVKRLWFWEPREIEWNMIVNYLKNLEHWFILPHFLISELLSVTKRKWLWLEFLNLHITELRNKHNLKFYCWDYDNVCDEALKISTSKYNWTRSADLTDSIFHSVANIIWWYFVTDDRVYYEKISDRYKENVILLVNWERIKNI